MPSETGEMPKVIEKQEQFAEQYKRVNEKRADYLSSRITHLEQQALEQRRNDLNGAVASVAEGYRQNWLKDKREGTAGDNDLDKIGVKILTYIAKEQIKTE